MKSDKHKTLHLQHDAYEHNHHASDKVPPYKSSTILLANSASCELKFH